MPGRLDVCLRDETRENPTASREVVDSKMFSSKLKLRGLADQAGDRESAVAAMEMIKRFIREVELHATIRFSGSDGVGKMPRLPASGKFGRIKVRAFLLLAPSIWPWARRRFEVRAAPVPLS